MFILRLLVLVNRCFLGRRSNNIDTSFRQRAHNSWPLDTNMSQFNPFTTPLFLNMYYDITLPNTGSTILKEWTTPDCRNTSSTTNLEEEEIVDALGNGGDASMPEQVKRPNPWRMMMILPYKPVSNFIHSFGFHTKIMCAFIVSSSVTHSPFPAQF